MMNSVTQLCMQFLAFKAVLAPGGSDFFIMSYIVVFGSRRPLILLEMPSESPISSFSAISPLKKEMNEFLWAVQLKLKIV